jgi:hypothetical protein
MISHLRNKNHMIEQLPIIELPLLKQSPANGQLDEHSEQRLR